VWEEQSVGDIYGSLGGEVNMPFIRENLQGDVCSGEQHVVGINGCHVGEVVVHEEVGMEGLDGANYEERRKADWWAGIPCGNIRDVCGGPDPTFDEMEQAGGGLEGVFKAAQVAANGGQVRVGA